LPSEGVEVGSMRQISNVARFVAQKGACNRPKKEKEDTLHMKKRRRNRAAKTRQSKTSLAYYPHRSALMRINNPNLSPTFSFCHALHNKVSASSNICAK
jgi:hypothetical protein